MDINRSRLSSITQQSNQNENNIKTSSALFNVYYQLYAIPLIGTNPMQEPTQVFNNLSHQVQQQIGNVEFEGRWTQAEEKQTILKIRKCIEERGSASSIIKQPVFLSKQQLKALLPSKLHPQPQLEFNSPIKQEQLSQSCLSKQLDETAQSKYSLQDIIQKLNDFDDERTQIKCQIYSSMENEQQNNKHINKNNRNTNINKNRSYHHGSLANSNKSDLLYTKWTNLHTKMKETLELYLGRISLGSTKSLIQLYNQPDIMGSQKNIQGISEKELLQKLDSYLQSLFLDERQILLYRQKDGNMENSSISKKLIYS